MEKNTVLKRETIPTETKSNSSEEISGVLLNLSSYIEILKYYQVVKEADLEALADLTARAKGPYRSMRQFAKDVGVSPATMSRIMNQKTAGMVNNELLAKIAANADKQSGVTMEMLLDANGEARKGTATSEKLKEDETRKILLDELIKRGYTVFSGIDETSTVRHGLGYTMRFDFAIETDAVGKEEGRRGKWLFRFKTSKFSTSNPEHKQTETGYYRQWLTMVTSMFYCGMANADRISCVTDSKTSFEQAKEVFNGVRIPNEISLLFVHNGRVVEEFLVPVTGEEPKEVFFKIAKRDEPQDSLNSEELDWDMDLFSHL